MNRALPVLLAVLLSGCASGPPGTSYPGTDLVLYTRAASPEALVVAQEANEFLTDLGDYLHLQVPPGALLRIYHYPNRWGLWWHLNRAVPSFRWRRGVCYEIEEAYVVTLSGNPGRRKFRDTLRHELTHYLVAAHFCDVPPWIDEGLSQVMASGPPFPHLEEDVLEKVQPAETGTGEDLSPQLSFPGRYWQNTPQCCVTPGHYRGRNSCLKYQVFPGKKR